MTTVVTEWRAPRCYGNFVRRHYNGLGQLVQEQHPDDDWRTDMDGCTPGVNYPEIDVDFAYDGLGHQGRVDGAAERSRQLDQPHWSTGQIHRHPAPPSMTHWIGPLRATAPNGAVTEYKYVDRKTVVIGRGRNGDPDKVLQWSERDGLDNLRLLRTYSKPFDQGGVVEGEIQLTYDVLGNLRQVLHPLGIGQTTFTYDLAGRKIGLNDPDLGAWSYAYDRRGQLTRQTDARGKTICLAYDILGRIVGKDFRTDASCPTPATYEVSFTYDQGHSPTNRALGQLTAARITDGSYLKTLTYNARGLLASATVSIGGAPQAYTQRYAYDTYDRLQATIYPDGEAIKEYPNSRGLPKLLCPACAAPHWRILVLRGTQVGGRGRLQRQRPTPQPHLPSRRRAPAHPELPPVGREHRQQQRPTRQHCAARRSASLLDLAYDYDTFGNVRQLTHNGVAASLHLRRPEPAARCLRPRLQLRRGRAPHRVRRHKPAPGNWPSPHDCSGVGGYSLRREWQCHGAQRPDLYLGPREPADQRHGPSRTQKAIATTPRGCGYSR